MFKDRLGLKAALGLAAGLSLISTGCAAPVLVGGFRLEAEHWQDAQDAVRRRAAFDLQCAEDALALTPLAVGMKGWFDDQAMQVGVVGCGQRAVYVRTSTAWVLNSDAARTPSPAQRPPTTPGPLGEYK